MTGWTQNPNILASHIAIERAPCALARGFVRQFNYARFSARFADLQAIGVFAKESRHYSILFSLLRLLLIDRSRASSVSMRFAVCQSLRGFNSRFSRAKYRMLVAAVAASSYRLWRSTFNRKRDIAPKASSLNWRHSAPSSSLARITPFTGFTIGNEWLIAPLADCIDRFWLPFPFLYHSVYYTRKV